MTRTFRVESLQSSCPLQKKHLKTAVYIFGQKNLQSSAYAFSGKFALSTKDFQDLFSSSASSSQLNIKLLIQSIFIILSRSAFAEIGHK